jgi:protein TonB
VLVGCAIALLHGAAIYGLTQVSPVERRAAAPTPLAVAFIAEENEPERLRPPEVQTIPPTITATQPVLPLVAVEPAPLTALTVDRAISAPAPATPPEDRAAPKLVSAVEYLREPTPRYPPQSRRLREQGVVVLRVVIDEQGRACNIEVETSSGYARLDRAAREAVASAAFRPYVEDGAPRRAQVLIPIEFSLSRGSA